MSLTKEFILREVSQEIRDTKDTKAITEALPLIRTLGRIGRAEFAMWAAGNNMRCFIEDIASDKENPLRAAALACKDVILGAANSIDFSLYQNVQLLGAWVAYGYLSQIEADILLELSTVETRYDELEVRRICWSDNGEWQL